MFTKNLKGHKSIRPGELGFTFCANGVTLVPRASVEISQNCPQHIADIILGAYNRGWIKPVANMRETEHLMEILKE